MIVEYHRPDTLQAALELLSRKTIHTLPLGGGTILSHHRGDPIAVVDLRNLGLNKIEQRGNLLHIGATVTLQQLLDSALTPLALKEIVRQETNHNLRQAATIAGRLTVAGGKSSLLAGLLAVEAKLAWQPDNEMGLLDDWLSQRAGSKGGLLITSIAIPLDVKLGYEFVGRTPMDLPIASVALGKWPSGRRRFVIGGFGVYPIVVLDDPDPGKLDRSIENACSQNIPTNLLNYALTIIKIMAHRLLDRTL
jgi:putative selenate reductase FAD-binding subunit